MATITLRNVPEATIQRLKADAIRNRRSLNQEVIVQLAESLGYDLTAEEFANIDRPRGATSAGPPRPAAADRPNHDDGAADGAP